MDKTLTDNMDLQVKKFQIYWPMSGDSSKRIPGPFLVQTDSFHWVEEGNPKNRYNTVSELIEDLADLEEAKRLKMLNDEFRASGIF